MVKLFLFRLGSLLLLFVLLIRETFYRQNKEDFTGMTFNINKQPQFFKGVHRHDPRDKSMPANIRQKKH